MDDATLTRMLCSRLGELPGWVWWEHDEPYPADSVGVFYGALDTAPDRAVGVRVYGTTDELHLRWRRVQLRLRGAPGQPDGADLLADAAHRQLTDDLPPTGISFISRESMAPAGVDENRRESRTENYLIILDNQEAHL